LCFSDSCDNSFFAEIEITIGNYLNSSSLLKLHKSIGESWPLLQNVTLGLGKKTFVCIGAADLLQLETIQTNPGPSVVDQFTGYDPRTHAKYHETGLFVHFRDAS
jgi:hypothetical protein